MRIRRIILGTVVVVVGLPLVVLLIAIMWISVLDRTNSPVRAGLSFDTPADSQKGGKHDEGEGLDTSDSLVACGAAAWNAGQVRNFRDPAPVVFTFELDAESQAHVRHSGTVHALPNTALHTLEGIGMKDREVFIVSRPRRTGALGFPNNLIEQQLGAVTTTRNW